MIPEPDFSSANAQRDWHAQWPRWINTLLAFQYVSHTETQESAEGTMAMEASLRWLRGMASNEEVARAMKAAFAVSPIRFSVENREVFRSAARAASVAACAINDYPETVMVYASMCVTDEKECAKKAVQVLEWLGPLTGPEDQLVAMDRLDELGALPSLEP